MKQGGLHAPTHINSADVHEVVNVTNNLPMSLHVDVVAKNAHQCLFPRKPKEFHHNSTDPSQFQSMHHSKRTIWMHHSLEWRLPCPRTQEILNISQHNPGLQTPWSFPCLHSPIGEKIQRHESTYHQI